MNAACIQSKEIKKEIRQLNKKLDKAHDLQNRLSTTQKQLILTKQNAFKAHDKLNQKSYHDLILTFVNWKKQEIDHAKRLSGTDPNK